MGLQPPTPKNQQTEDLIKSFEKTIKSLEEAYLSVHQLYQKAWAKSEYVVAIIFEQAATDIRLRITEYQGWLNHLRR